MGKIDQEVRHAKVISEPQQGCSGDAKVGVDEGLHASAHLLYKTLMLHLVGLEGDKRPAAAQVRDIIQRPVRPSCNNGIFRERGDAGIERPLRVDTDVEARSAAAGTAKEGEDEQNIGRKNGR